MGEEMIKLCENEEELIEVAKIHVDSQRATYVGILEQSYLENLNYEDSILRWKEWMKKGDREVLVYVDNNEVVGFSAVKFYQYEAGSGILSNLHVRANMHHKGIGSALISASMGLLCNMGLQSMYIDVIIGNNRAEALYSFLGAEFCFSEKNYKRYIWKDVKSIADLSIAPREQYDYESIIKVMQKEYILFGAGEYSDVFIKQFPNQLPIKIFDNNVKKHGTYKEECLIVAPEQTNETIIIASCYYQEIEKQLLDLNCKNIICFYPWHNYHKEKVGV